jgi:hypothetical protein
MELSPAQQDARFAELQALDGLLMAALVGLVRAYGREFAAAALDSWVPVDRRRVAELILEVLALEDGVLDRQDTDNFTSGGWG